MIFVTVGHQMPFDRMIRLVDNWAAAHPATEIFAQIGETSYVPQNIGHAQLLSRDDYDARSRDCEAVIAHAGTGTIIQTLLQQKPLLVLPRLSRFGETRNDHQVGTARHFADRGLIAAAFDDAEFKDKLDRLQDFRPAHTVGNQASAELLKKLRDFIAATPTA